MGAVNLMMLLRQDATRSLTPSQGSSKNLCCTRENMAGFRAQINFFPSNYLTLEWSVSRSSSLKRIFHVTLMCFKSVSSANILCPISRSFCRSFGGSCWRRLWILFQNGLLFCVGFWPRLQSTNVLLWWFRRCFTNTITDMISAKCQHSWHIQILTSVKHILRLRTQN